MLAPWRRYVSSDTSSRRFSPKDANRVAHFDHFRGYALPYTNITCRVDVTNLIDRCKARKEAIFPAMLIAVTCAVNAVEQLRQRIDGDEIVEYSVVHPAYTTLLTDDTIRFCPTQCSDDRSQFIKNIADSKQYASNDGPLEPHVGRYDLFFVSVLPWLDFTQMQHPAQTQNGDSVPRIAWGKFSGDTTHTMPVSLQVHHALVDGLHMARFFEALQEELNRDW
jgi:chloramphenicol O-acetyltransferase